MTDFIGLLNLITGVFQIGTGIVVFILSNPTKVRRYYSLSSFFLGLWSLSIFFYTNPVLFSTTTWLKIVYTVAYCMTLSLIVFARVYPKKVEKKFKNFLIANIVYMTIMSAIVWKTSLVVVSTTYDANTQNTYAVMGPLYILYGLPEFITAVYIVGYYLKQVSVLSGIEKRQVQFYVTGGIMMLIPVALFDFVFPLFFNITSLYKYSTIGNVFWTMLVGYSIFTTRFLDIRLVFGVFLSIVLKGILILLCLVITIVATNPLGEATLTASEFIKLFGLSVLFTGFLVPSFVRIDKLLSEKIIHSKYDPVKDVKEFTDTISKSLNLNTISESLLSLIDKSFKPNLISIIVIDSSGNILLKKEKNVKDVEYVGQVREVLDAWRNLNSNRILVYSELRRSRRAGKRIIDAKRDAILSFMEKHSIEIIFSIKEIGKFDGMVMIGENHDKGAYTVGDINFLDNVMQSVRLALIRSVLYSELSSFNATLQEKVNEQTQELQDKVEELEEARRKERDMIDIMGHELRTPATVAKLNVELLEKCSNDPMNCKKHLDRIKDAINNSINLINTLLSSAKLEGNKIEINKEEVDICSKVEESVHSYESDAQDKGLKIFNKVSSDTPSIYADTSRVLEVLNNFVSNAVKYTEEGSITIESSYDSDTVTIRVIDTGVGIPKEDISKLGEKFYRVKNYTDNFGTNIVRPGGTGLGLYVSFNLIKNMGGEVKVESELGKGSVFGFKLPRYKGQIGDTPIKKVESKNVFEKLGLKKVN